MLANPAAPTRFITENWHTSPKDALPNPALDADVANELADRYAETAANPNISEHARVASLGSFSARRRAAAAANPNTTTAELTALLDAERAGAADTRVLNTVKERLERLRWGTDPFACPAGWLTIHPHHPQVHTELLNLDDTGRDTVTNLLRSRFDGTVAELFDVASTFR